VPLPLTEALHPFHPLAANVAGKQRAEPVPPVTENGGAKLDHGSGGEVLLRAA
jgi:hypothetical protein